MKLKLRSLKKLRIAVSLIFFLLTAVIFLDFTSSLHQDFISAISYLQLIPSLIKFITVPVLAAAGFILIIILTLFIGRVYCSSICPLGTLQDIISYFTKKVKGQKFYHFSKEQLYWRYSILAAVVLTSLSGFILLINLLDPFSNFGKIFVSLIKPVFIVLNNAAAYSLEGLGVYLIYPYEIAKLNYLNLIYPVIFLSIVFLLVYRGGRLFCNSVCPVGTFLGLISKVAFIKVAIHVDKCRSCKLCERVCKAGCIDKANKHVDFSRCVSCYNCFTVCSSNAIIFRKGYSGRKENKSSAVDVRKRKYISKSIVAVLALAGFNYSQIKIIPKKKSTVPVNKNYPASAPGSGSIKHFNERCTACHLCMSVCPTHVLQPSIFEYGLIGLFQPVMDYSSGFCNYECKICTDVCPSGAILTLPLEKKKLVQIGKAKFIKDNCIVHTENTACGACSEHCPTKAVNMVPYKSIHIPEVKEEYCMGCGACEFACPTQPFKAIYVDGNPVHLSAKKKIEEKLEQKVEEDFPF